MSSLRLRMSVSNVLLALGSVVLAGLIANLVLRGRFDQYLAANIAGRINQLSVAISAARDPEGNWNTILLEQLGISALEDGFLVTVIDASGITVWDARTHNAGLCSAMISSMAERMSGFGSGQRGEYREQRLLLASHHGQPEQVQLLVGYWGPVYYRDADLDFLDRLNHSLALAGALSLALASVVGIISARRLSAPLLQAAQVSRQIAAGDYRARLRPSPITEVAALAASLSGMAEALEQQERLRRQLVVDASHELRTPLAALRGRLEGMKDGVIPADQDSLIACLRQVERLTDLTRSLERLSAISARSNHLRPTRFRLDTLLLGATANLAVLAEQSGIRFMTDALPELEIVADESLILQAVENLLTNAIRYGLPVDSGSRVGQALEPALPVVRVAAVEAGSWVEVRVSDQGIGLAADQLPLVFERFYRVDPSRDRASGGFGVGLSMVREILLWHGGTAWAESAGLGLGSCFVLRWPKECAA